MRRKLSTPTAIPAASPEDLRRAKLALGENPSTIAEKPPTVLDEIKQNEKWLKEPVKQVKTREQAEKDFEQRLTALLKEQEEDARRDARAKAEASDEEEEDSKPERIYYDLGNIDYHLGDEDPITKVAGFNIPDSALAFQKYQFDPRFKRCGSGAKTVKWTDKYALGPMIDSSSWGTITPFSEAAQSMISSQGENQLRQSQAKGLMIMDEYFNFIGEPRKAVEESAWIFDDLRFRDFIIRQVEQEDVDWYGKNPKADLDDIAWRFGRPLKTFFGVYHFFRAGMADKEISDAEGVTIPAGLWKRGKDGTDIAARTRDRAYMMGKGFELYGCGPVGKDLDPGTVTRSRYLWPFFESVRKEILKGRKGENGAGDEK
jgi:hypothetical protein